MAEYEYILLGGLLLIGAILERDMKFFDYGVHSEVERV